MKTLLINPPFAGFNPVNLSIPVLYTYLQSNGMPVSVWDANIDFWNVMLQPNKIIGGRNYMESRFLQLNSKRRLSQNEKLEYNWFANVLIKADSITKERYDLILRGEKKRTHEQISHINYDLNTAIQLSSAECYPDKLRHTIKKCFHESTYSPYSTSDILKSLETTSIFDDFYKKYVFDIIEIENPQVVGFSVTFEDQALAAFRCASMIKKIYPKIHITFGGAWISITMEKLKNPLLFNILDSIILYDGEVPLLCLIKELVRKTPDYGKVPGIIYIEKNKIRIIPPAKPLDMETLPPPDFSCISLDKYPFEKSMISLSYRTSRGCNWRKCIFCSYNSGFACHHQQAGADYVFKCLKHIREQTGIFSFAFMEENSDPIVLENLSRYIIDSKNAYFWVTNIKLHPNLTMERCMLYKKAGCRRLGFGIETYNDRLLKFIGKGLNIKTIDYSISNLAWAGISSMAYMMVGLPTETEKEAVDSYKSILNFKNNHLLTTYQYSALELLPGAEITNNPDKFGIRILNSNENYDLAPPDIKFEGTPISPARADELAKKFADATLTPHLKRKNMVSINGRNIIIKHMN